MKDFIPHEPAFALKELGFDEPCLGYYLCRNSAFGIDELFITTEWIDLLPYDSSSCKAPTYSQALRWFREKYNLISYIHPLALLQDTKKWCYEITNFESSWDEDIDLHSPEEAELECLKKLIEIVKTK